MVKSSLLMTVFWISVVVVFQSVVLISRLPYVNLFSEVVSVCVCVIVIVFTNFLCTLKKDFHNTYWKLLHCTVNLLSFIHYLIIAFCSQVQLIAPSYFENGELSLETGRSDFSFVYCISLKYFKAQTSICYPFLWVTLTHK